MELGQRAGSLHRRAAEPFGDALMHLQLWFLFASLAVLVAFLAAKIGWYWQTFGWLGVVYAILLSWILLGAGLITYRDLFHPAWLARPKAPAARARLEPHMPDPRHAFDPAVTALRNELSSLQAEVGAKIAVLDEAVIPVVRAHARMILLLTDRDRFLAAAAQFEKSAQAIRSGFLARGPLAQYASTNDPALEQACEAMARLLKSDFGEQVVLWPDLGSGESPPAPNENMIIDMARRKEYRAFHRRHGAASRLIQEFKARYDGEMERVTEIVAGYARGISKA